METKFSETARIIAKERYAQPGEEIEDIFSRVAHALAQVEKKYIPSDNDCDLIIKTQYDLFFNQMINKKLIPAGRTLANAGTDNSVVANCVVLPIEDSMDSIGKTLHDAMLLQQQGCGIGFDFSTLRPAKFDTKISRGVASGPVSFMKVYDNVFSTIKQQGRHGANMGMLRIDHPDILDFISCKEKEGDINNFNISVLVTDEFMNMLCNSPSSHWKGKFNDKIYNLREIVHENDMFGSKETVTEIPFITVEDVWDILCSYAHKNGEPGIAFIDTVNANNPLPGLGPITASNPCSEQMLHNFDNCNLLSINLGEFHNNWDDLEDTVSVAIRMLDNTIDLFNHNVDSINSMAFANRRVGLGIMGWADYLFKNGVSYGSEESIILAEEIMKYINDVALKTSKHLGFKRGIFTNWKESIYRDQDSRHSSIPRNVARTSIAPTGSISMIFDVNSGIEPYFSLAYNKKVRAGEFIYVAPALLEYLSNNFDKLEVDAIVKELRNGIPLNGIEELTGYKIDGSAIETFVTTMDINVEDHIKMQAAFQRHVDNAISKTINFSNDASIEDIGEAYKLAWKSKCKSVAVYRDKSRENQILSTLNKDESIVLDIKEIQNDNIDFHGIIDRPRQVAGNTYMVKTAHGNMYVVINEWIYNGKQNPYEVFVHIGKEGGDLYSYMSALTRMVSLSLRSGVPLDQISEQLLGIACHTNWDNGVRYEGPVDALAKVLKEYSLSGVDRGGGGGAGAGEAEDGGAGGIGSISIANSYDFPGGIGNKKDIPVVNETMDTSVEMVSPGSNCPECQVPALIHQEGCEYCTECGWSRC